MNPLRCDEVKSSLIDYLEFELPLTRREHFYEHLARCTSCQAKHNELQQVLSEAKKIDIIEPPESYWDELPGNVLKEVESLRSSIGPSFQVREDEGSGFDNEVFSDDGKVIDFKSAKEHGRKTKNIDIHQNPDLRQVTAKNQEKSIRKPVATNWPKVALPIAAAVLIGIAATFTFLEPEPTNIQDQIGFQAQIRSEKPLVQLAQEITPLSQPGNQFGFASQRALFNGFSIGSMFSEAKVYASSNQLAPLKTYLQLLKTALQNEITPQGGVIRDVVQLQQDLERRGDISSASQVLTQLLNEYALSVKEQDARSYELVKAGAWLFDYTLAVLAEDDVSIRQPDQLSLMVKTLGASNVPPGVIMSLGKIQDIVEKPALSQRHYQQILKEVENIRSLLG